MWRSLRIGLVIVALAVVLWAPAGAVVGEVSGGGGEGRADIDPNG
jgi:hypothetical protein